MEPEKILENIDQLFKQNKTAEAERYMLEVLNEAAARGNAGIVVLMLNELLGHYRVTSEREKLQDTIDRVLLISRQTGQNQGIDYATTLLNVATAYRSLDELELSAGYYDMVKRLYEENLAPDDLRMASFYNNYSLLKQEMGDWKAAEALQLKGLEIAEQAGAGYETGTSYSNLSGTYIGLKEYEKAEHYARRAKDLLESRGELTTHYCAALFSLGICCYENGNMQEGNDWLAKAMKLVEESAGRSDQYLRMEQAVRYYQTRNSGEKSVSDEESNRVADTETNNKRKTNTEPETASIKGLELCRRYFETYGLPMLQEKFSGELDHIAAGLIGEGSDCLGFDDAASRDHDWGPGFCLFVTAETYDRIGETLQEAYDGLPREFLGFTRTVTPQGKKRLGVHILEETYREFLGGSGAGGIDYSRVDDAALLAACSGEIFTDPEGTLTQIVTELRKGYPERVQYLKLAEDAARFAQTGQYNYLRVKKRGDGLTADAMLFQCYQQAMRLWHHANHAYPPHEKWLMASTRNLSGGLELTARIHEIYRAQMGKAPADLLAGMVDELGAFLAASLYEKDLISDIEPYLGEHVDELLKKAEVAPCSNAELARKIARLEFEAFDKVKNEGGRANCQDDWPTFSVMRKSQYLTWNRTMLLQYYYDFDREYHRGHNLITEKYGRMMESTAQARYEEIKDNFPELSAEKKAVIDQIVALQMAMMEEFSEKHPQVANNARSLHTYEDNLVNTSYETYLRGEISTYSDKMLQLYGRFVVECAATGKNIAYMTIENTAKLYGFEDLEAFERSGGQSGN